MSRVLLLDYSTDRVLGPATARWLPTGTPLETWTMLDEQPLPPLDGVTHLLHTGSALSINDDHPFLPGVFALVRQAVERGLSQFGFCYGHQLLARALGGREAVRRNPAGPEIGYLEVSFTTAGMAHFHVPRRCTFWQFHYDEVIALPDSARVLATSAGCGVQAFHDPELRLTGTQFHPEVDRELGNRIYREKAEQLAREGFDAERLVEGCPEGFDMHAIMARFVAP